MKGGYVYIMAHSVSGTLYVGVTAEPHDRIDQAIAREKAIKVWKRAWKLI